MSMVSLNIGLSALQASQQALQTVAHNLANASTPGYHRQQVQMADRLPNQVGNLLLGAGVDVSRILRIRSALVEQSLTANLSARSDAAAQLETLQRLETLFTPGEGGIQSRLQSFFDQMFQVTSGPDNNILRRQAVLAAANLADEINAIAGAMHQLQQSLEAEIQTVVRAVNQLSERIAALNRQIGVAEGNGLEPHDLRDQRDQLVNELAAYVDVRTWEWAGQPDVAAFAVGGVPLSTQPVTISMRVEAGVVQVCSDQSGQPLGFGGGRLGGLLAARNDIVPAAQARLQEFVDALVRQLDQIQATGLGSNGPFGWLESTRAVADVSAPLASAGAAFPIEAGQLAISVTDLATGQRRLACLAIDPSVDSLADLAAAIDAIDHLQAVVNPQTGKLSIRADSGFAFDFAGRLETVPDTSAVTGTSGVRISGRYTGGNNDVLQFSVVGTGQVGVSAGLQVEVRNSAGVLLRTLDVGLGYEPGAALPLGDGVAVSFGPGTLNAADSFSTPVVANADTARLLSAIGIRTFFGQTGAGGLSLNPQLLSDPGQLAVSQSGLPGDGLNASRFAAVRDRLLLHGGTLTLEEFLAESAARIGGDVQHAATSLAHLESLGVQLENDRESVSGVDPNEELVRMLQYQRGFQSAARLISIVNQTLDELFAMVP